MTTALSLLVVGLLLGIRHASDPDHVVAVSTIVSRQRSLLGAVGIGALWGLGHTATVFVIGTGIVLFKLAITPRLGLAMEFCVALMLIVLGVQNLRAARSRMPLPAPARLRPLVVGMVHGLAGSAAVTLAVIALIPDPLWALACLVVFGLGTMLGMALITLAIAVPAVYAAGRVDRIERGLRFASGVASVGFGLFLAHQIGVADGLFTDSPRWEPK